MLGMLVDTFRRMPVAGDDAWAASCGLHLFCVCVVCVYRV